MSDLNAKEIIGNELAIQDINDVRIAKMHEEYMPLVITDLKNEKQFDAVHQARMVVKKSRILIQNVSKKTRERAVQFQKDCIAEEKRLVGLIEPIEAHLESEEGKVEAEKARIKAEAEQKEAIRLQERIQGLVSLGCIFDGQNYIYGNLKAPIPLIKVADDEQFGKMFEQISEVAAADAKKKADEETARKAEAERIAKVQAEQEAERKRLEEIARKQEEENARIKAEQEAAAQKIRDERAAIESEKKRLADAEAARLKKIEDEKKKAEEAKTLAERIERERKEAAEKAIRDAEEKANREAEEKAKREEALRIAAEKKAARAPDKVKLLALADAMEAVTVPCMKTEEGKIIVGDFQSEIAEAINNLRGRAEAL